MSDCARCKELEELLVEAETAIAELGRQRAGLELIIRRSGQSEVALRNELAQQREDEPDAPQIREVCDHWKLVLGKSQRTKTPLNGKRAKTVRARLRDRFTVDDLKKAIDGCAKFPYVGPGGRNGTGLGKRYDDLELICRDEVHVEQFMALADEDPNPTAAPPPVPRPNQHAATRRPDGPTGVPAILDKLEGVKPVRPGQWDAKCPAHEDRHASLSVGQGDKGAVLHCHAGCTTDQIVHALGLDVATLFDPEDAPAKPKPKARMVEALPPAGEIDRLAQGLARNPRLLDRLFELRKWTAPTLERLRVGFDGRRLTFPVYDQAGELVNVLRYLPRRIDDQPKLLAARGRPRDLWPRPETIDGDVWLVEGEPDAISGWELNLPAVGIPGANGWRTDMAPRFEGRRVTICLDCDDPGRKLARRVFTDLCTVAVTDVRVLDLEPERSDGYDLSDALLEGADNEILVALADAIVTQQVAA